MAISAEPFQIFGLIIISIGIAMMDNQYPFIANTASAAFFRLAASLQQCPINGLAGLPIRCILATAPIFILPGAVATDRAEKFLTL